MIIYGVALLSFCLLTGLYLGDVLGALLGINANVGGVGIAMLMLIFLSHVTPVKNALRAGAEGGVQFWNQMYIPIVIAMAAKQNVLAALSGGWLAIAAGVLAVVLGFLLVPVLAGRHDAN